MARVYNQGVANKQKKEGTYAKWFGKEDTLYLNRLICIKFLSE